MGTGSALCSGFIVEASTRVPCKNHVSGSIDNTIIRVGGTIVRAVNNKLLVSLSAIGSQQSSAIEDTNKAIHQLLDYCAAYPDDGILYRSSDMILAGHSDAVFKNETRAQRRDGDHIFCLKINPSLVGMDPF